MGSRATKTNYAQLFPVKNERMYVVCVGIFCLIFSLTILFAYFTDHRWEDWYITYRASKNLATGNGLVFTVGQRVHSFTSPIGTLLPAVLNVITFNKSDDLVIWLFRLINAVMLGFTAVNLFTISRYKGLSNFNIAAFLALFAFNILIIDFSINGMETAFMVFFMSCLIKILLVPGKSQVKGLALVFAGLMYTRPDGFIYGGAIILGFLCFNYKINEHIKTRVDFIKLLTKAAVIAIALYLPWVIATLYYYGSPIPHTITAKAVAKHYSISYIWHSINRFPKEFITTNISSNLFFVPPYAGNEIEKTMLLINRVFGIICIFSFILKIRPEARALSLATYLIAFYLAKISGQAAMPWYIANVSFLAIVTLAFACSLEKYKSGPYLLIPVVAFSLYTFILGAIELKAQQEVIENGNRKQIGLWLKEKSSAGDTVFLEPLGYIGFYSGLKTYDYPGMSSPEVVKVTKQLHTDKYAVIIKELWPTWLVLRPHEIKIINDTIPGLLEDYYKEERIFDVSNNIPSNIIGRHYLEYDAKFIVFHIK